MSLPVIIRPAAEADIQETHDYLEGMRAGLGDQFAARLRDVLERIESMPEARLLFGKMFARCACGNSNTLSIT